MLPSSPSSQLSRRRRVDTIRRHLEPTYPEAGRRLDQIWARRAEVTGYRGVPNPASDQHMVATDLSPRT